MGRRPPLPALGGPGRSRGRQRAAPKNSMSVLMAVGLGSYFLRSTSLTVSDKTLGRGSSVRAAPTRMYMGGQRARGASWKRLRNTLPTQQGGVVLCKELTLLLSKRSWRLYPPSLCLSRRSDGGPRCVQLQRACTWSAALLPV